MAITMGGLLEKTVAVPIFPGTASQPYTLLIQSFSQTNNCT